MSTYFSIGEIAKMFNISTQTLRLYDRLDLIKPAYINENNGYRYYSVEQFIKLDCIKLCKSMGLSLDEIKELTGNDSSVESMLDITRKQKVTLENKIKELESMKSHLDSFENRIEESIKTGFNKIVLVDNEERALIKYSNPLRTQKELELNLRKVILEVEESYGMLRSDIGFTISYESFLKNNELLFKDILIILYDYHGTYDEKITILPKGMYLTMYIENSSFDNRKYYNEMIRFAEENNINVTGDFIETEIIARVNKDGQGNNLAKIELLCM